MIRAMKNRDPNERDQDSAANEAEMYACSLDYQIFARIDSK